MSGSRSRVRRSEDRIVAGVLGGFAEHFEVDPTVFRLAMLFLIVATGIVPGIVTYLVAILIIPSADDRIVAGVLLRLSNRIGVDPTIVRLAAVVLVLATGILPGLIAYLIGAIILPNEKASPGATTVSDETV